MNLPPPLIATLRHGLNPAKAAQAMDRIREINGVIHAAPRDPKNPACRDIVVLYSGTGVADELRKMESIDSVGEAPPLKRNPRPPAP